MTPTNKTLKAFIEWYKVYEPKSDWKYPAIEYFENHDMIYKTAVLTEFYDQNEIAIKVDPSNGGGPIVFYGSVIYRGMGDNISREEEIGLEELIYTDTRIQMQKLCLEMANSIFNSNTPDLEGGITDDELEDLPF